MASDKWIIPTDWDEENDGQLVVVFCIPNSRQWRGLITAHVNTLTYGRAWNEQTGNLKQNLEIAREIFATMTMCDFESLKVDVGRIAAALESLEEKTPELVTLQDLLDDLDGNLASSALSEFVPIFELLTVLGGLFPSLAVKINATDLISKVFEYFTWRAPVLGLLGTMDVSLAGIALGTLGTGASAFLQLLGTGSEAATKLWWQTINGVGDFFGWWDDLYDWWGGSGGDPEPTDEERWAQAKIFNDVFVEGNAVTVNNYVDVSTCCGGQSGSVELSPGGAGFSVPDGMIPPDSGITDRKCKAATWVSERIQSMLAAAEITTPPQWYQLADLEDWLRTTVDGSFEDLIGSLYGSWINLAGAVFGSTVDFGDMYDEWQSNFDDIVCGLVEAGTTGQARQNVLDVVSALSEGEKSFLSELLTNNILNLLWYGYSDLEDVIGDVSTDDCSGCALSCDELTQHMGGATVRAGDFEWSSYISESNGIAYVTVLFGYSDGSYCGDPVTVSNLHITVDELGNKHSEGFRFRYYEQDGTQIGGMYYVGDNPASVANVGRISVHHSFDGSPPVTGYFQCACEVS